MPYGGKKQYSAGFTRVVVAPFAATVAVKNVRAAAAANMVNQKLTDMVRQYVGPTLTKCRINRWGGVKRKLGPGCEQLSFCRRVKTEALLYKSGRIA